MNDNENINNKFHQLMGCFLCYLEPIETCNKITNSSKCFISYYKKNEITSLKNHVDEDHVALYKKIKEEINNFERKCGKTSWLKNVHTYLSH